jgi:hypothetical protein
MKPFVKWDFRALKYRGLLKLRYKNTGHVFLHNMTSIFYKGKTLYFKLIHEH